MTKIVQIRGDSFDTIKDVVLESRELAVDTSNYDLLIGDGATPGGRRILSEENSDEKYQIKSPELDGFVEFQPQDKGLMVRLGPAQYALRAITSTQGSLTVTNPRGQAGNINIRLADEIPTDHAWTGTQTFAQAIEAEGGVNGDVAGNTSGTHTGPVTGNVTGNLDGDSAGTHTGPQVGPVDARGEDFLLDDGAIPLGYLGADAIDFINAAGVPPGSIIMWYGSIVSIPDGWFLCDGNNGTPDLRGAFVLGAGGSINPGAVGGSTSHSHALTVNSGGSHTHTSTAAGTALTVNQLPAHKHTNGIVDNIATLFNKGSVAAVPTAAGSVESNGATGTLEGYTSDVGAGQTHTHTITVDAGGSHTHTGTADSASNIPPYLALAYIMKGL